MKKLLFIILLSGCSLLTKAQTPTPPVTPDGVYVAVETDPTFPGGLQSFYTYLAKNAKYNGSDKGRVLITFVVEKDGSLTNIKVMKGLSEKADKEATRLISESPKWIPGTQNKRAVRVQYTVPINFQ